MDINFIKLDEKYKEEIEDAIFLYKKNEYKKAKYHHKKYMKTHNFYDEIVENDYNLVAIEDEKYRGIISANFVSLNGEGYKERQLYMIEVLTGDDNVQELLINQLKNQAKAQNIKYLGIVYTPTDNIFTYQNHKAMIDEMMVSIEV